ncbi:Uncharacterised protein [Vibrio cholerae]|nr:Uncharacterised protein [Vibrio cholerae]
MPHHIQFCLDEAGSADLSTARQGLNHATQRRRHIVLHRLTDARVAACCVDERDRVLMSAHPASKYAVDQLGAVE